MPKLKRFIFLVLSGIFLYGCSPEHSKIVVATYGDSQITMAEFEKAYAKNSGGTDKAKDDSLAAYKNFLDLYVNFSMKLKDAGRRGYDADKEMQAELLDYKKKVGVTYIQEKLLIEPKLLELYNMRKTEFKVSHIMIRPDSAGDEAARKKAEDVIAKYRGGQSFESLAEEYSEDTYSKKQGGDIYFITAGTIIPEFEDPVYELKVGELYPTPVKTKYGYHVIRVTEIRERIPQVKASHIMVDFFDADGNSDSVAAKAKIDSLYQAVMNGADFAELAVQHSEDQGTARNGGDLGFFERRMMVKEFDETAFNLLPGQVSGVIKTGYGYHIIKVTERKPYPSFEEDKENLKRIYKNTRYERDYTKLIDNLKLKYNYSVNESVVDELAKKADSTRANDEYRNADWTELKAKPIINIGTTRFSVNEFMESILPLNEFINRYINRAFIEEGLKKFGGERVIEIDALNLEKTNSDFSELMADYKNGIYIFKLQDEEVWSKIVLDSTRLYSFWEKVREKYRFENRVEFAEIFSKSDSVINVYYQMLKNGEPFDSLASKFTERPGYKEKAGKFQILNVNSSQQSTEAWKLSKEGDYSAPFAVTGGFSIIKLIRKDPAREKSFDEARAEVSGAFQEEESKRLEKAYIESLEKDFNPVRYYEKLESAFKGSAN
ncbi:MAG: peptidylprolyl isomerase [Ignavibacteriaceae bacterium]|nr:peptidylprolyl isomerase [Ignavibacteriaceae bacterium]